MPGEFVSQLQPGMKVGKYQIVSLVATGGMAMIYKAYDKSLDRYVAIKQIAPNLAADEKFLERFRREAQVLARLSQGQQNVVAVYELIEEGGGLFMVMEFVEGTSLQALMDRGPASLNTGMGILLKITLGLKAIHAQGIVHRDLKPDNIMVQASGGVKIADFGLIGRTGGRTSLPMGTTQYMAPEMFAGGPVDSRADIYSLGFVAYQMFVGPEKFREIFSDIFADEQSASIRWMHWHSNPQMKAPSLREVQPGVPPLVARIVERMMEKDVSRRFASADQIIKWLRQIFVMYVQGKSVSEDESARMEKQVDEEIDGQTPTSGGSVPQRRPSGAAPATSGGESPKTAPLPKRRWGTYEYAKYGGVAAAVLVVAIIVMTVVSRAQEDKLRALAKDALDAGMAKYELKEFGEAARVYGEMIGNPEFRGLLEIREAKFMQMMSRAEEALAQKDFKQAEEYSKQAHSLIGSNNEFFGRQNGLSSRIRNEGRFDMLTKQYEGAMERNDLRAAEETVKTIVAEGVAPDRALTESWLAAIEKRRVQNSFRDTITAADKARDRDQLPEAKTLYLKAEELLADHPDLVTEREIVRGKMESLERHGQIKTLEAEAGKAYDDKKWALAGELYDQIINLLDADSRANRPELTRRRDEARSMDLTERAEGLLAQGSKESTQGAIKLLDQALTLWPANKRAAELKYAAANMEALQALIRQADAAEAKRDWKTAIEALRKAKGIEVDPEQRNVHEKRITRCTINDLMDQAHQAERDDDLDKALLKAQEAQKLDPNDRGILAYIRKLEQLRPYRDAVKRAKDALAKEDFPEARKWAKTARDIMNTGEAADLIKEVEYRAYFFQGKKSFEAGRWAEAKSYFGIAKGHKATEEVKKMIEECDRRNNMGP